MSPATATPAEPVAASRAGAGRAVVLARVALLPPAVVYALAVIVSGVVAALAAGTSPGGEPGLGQALAVGVPLWLATHLVPLKLSGVPLGVLPLAPAVGAAALVAVVARSGVRRLGSARASAGVPVVATAAAAHAAIGVLAAALLTPDAVIDASPAQAGVVCGLVAGAAALVGVARPCGLVDAALDRLPGWARAGFRAGTFAVVALLSAGAALLLATLLADASAVVDVFTRSAPEAGSGAGLALLSAAYLPNAVVGATSWVAGPGASVGLASATPTAAVAGPLPAVPLLAVMPSGPPPSWAGLTFAVPLAVGSLVGWKLAPAARDAVTRLRALGTAAATAAVVLGLLAALAGGRLGSGLFDPVSVPPLLLAGATLGWVLVPGAVVALLAVPDASGGSAVAAGWWRRGTSDRDRRPARTTTARSRSRTAGRAGRDRTGETRGSDDTGETRGSADTDTDAPDGEGRDDEGPDGDDRDRDGEIDQERDGDAEDDGHARGGSGEAGGGSPPPGDGIPGRR